MTQRLSQVDWPTVSLAEIGKVVRGASPRPAGDPRYFNGDAVPWLTVAALTNLPDSTLIVTETSGSLTELGAQFSRSLSPGTLIIANSGATLGVAKLLGISCCANDGIAAVLSIRSDVDPAYVAHQINSQTEVLRTVVATGNGQPNLNTGLIGAIRIPLPSYTEQLAISDALLDTDSLIDSLEQLLTKQRQIKQGAMQELLTGKRRLPGFKAPWESGVLGQVIADLVAGVSVNSDLQLGGIGVPSVVKTSAIASGVFDPLECKPIIKADLPRAATKPRKDTLLISRMNTPDLVGDVGYVDQDYDWLYLPDRIWMASPAAGSQVSVRWLGHLLSSPPFKRLIGDAATGTSGSMKNISKGALLSIPVSCPDPAEQHAIAQVLTDMDTSLTALQARLTKARQLKQALMQVLLTGRIRLLPPGAAAAGASPA